MNDRPVTDTPSVLNDLVKEARQFHDHAVAQRVVEGSFDGDSWIYRGSRVALDLKYCPKLHSTSSLLLRCFVVATIQDGLTFESVIGRVRAFRLVHELLVSKQLDWTRLNGALLSELVSSWGDLHRDATIYHRANQVTRLVEFLNGIHGRSTEGERRFLRRHLRWKHGIANPIRSALDQTSTSFSERREKNFEPELHIALGQARARVLANPAVERTPGYDRIRLESLAFSLALGIRVGEVTSLPINAYEYDPDVGCYFVRVVTQKSELPSARPVPDLWVEAISAANAYLLETCQAARARAKEIEERGFAFLWEGVQKFRDEYSPSSEFLSQLEAMGLDVRSHCLIHELTGSFDVSYKEFCAGGKYASCTLALPRPTAARLACWLDERFARWDWAEFGVRDKRAKRDGWKLSTRDISRWTGLPRSSIDKSSWFISDLKAVLHRLELANQFEPCAAMDQVLAVELRNGWQNLREQMLAHRGGNSGIAIDLAKLEMRLSKRYRRHLAAHFKENLSDENSEGGGFVSKHARAGMQQKLSEHLIVVWENQFSNGTSSGFIPKPLLRAELYNYLCGSSGKKSVFERFDVRTSSGQLFNITPHDIRRWVTTALLRSGPAEAAVDIWMGRSPRQTRQYDYRTASERAEFVRARYTAPTPPGDFLGSKVKFWRSSGLSEEAIEQLVAEKLRVLHFTPWGACSRELYISPCDRGLMCLRGFGSEKACKSFVLNDRDAETRRRIVDMRDSYVRMLAAVDPRLANVRNKLEEELGASEPLDQHLLFMRDMVESLDSALESCARAELASEDAAHELA